MPIFPVSSRSPSFEGFVEELSDEVVQVASKASGLPVLNKIFTFDPKTWRHTLNFVSQVDKESIVTFYKANCDVPFNWLNEQDDKTYEVVFDGPPKCRIDGEKELWRVILTFIQYSTVVI